MRVQPHFQDTGGFFIAVLCKKDWLPWQSKTKTGRAQACDQRDGGSNQERASSPSNQNVDEEEASLRTLYSDKSNEDAGMEVEGCDGHTPSIATADGGASGGDTTTGVKVDGSPSGSEEGVLGLEGGGDGGGEGELEAEKAGEDGGASDLAPVEVGDTSQEKVVTERPSAAILGK